MRKLNSKGFTAFEVIIIVVALVAIGAVGYFAYEARQDKNNYTTNTQSKSKLAKSVDPYAGWATYKGSCSGFSFMHPSDWVEKLGATSPLGCQVTTVTSPNGNVLVFVPSYYGDGPGCDFSTVMEGGENNCPNIATISIEALNKSGDLAGISLYEQILCDNNQSCEARVVLAKPTEHNPAFKVGTQRIYPVAVFGTSAFYMTQGKETGFGNPPQAKMEFSKVSAEEWLKSKDVQQAKLALKSISK